MKRLFGIFPETSCMWSTTSAAWKSTAMLASENALACREPFLVHEKVHDLLTAIRIARSRSRSIPIMM